MYNTTTAIKKILKINEMWLAAENGNWDIFCTDCFNELSSFIYKFIQKVAFNSFQLKDIFQGSFNYPERPRAISRLPIEQ